MPETLPVVKGYSPNIMSATFNVNQTQLSVTSFWGGTERGRCLQVNDSNGFVQLTVQDCVELSAVIQAFALGHMQHLTNVTRETGTIFND